MEYAFYPQKLVDAMQAAERGETLTVQQKGTLRAAAEVILAQAEKLKVRSDVSMFLRLEYT